MIPGDFQMTQKAASIAPKQALGLAIRKHRRMADLTQEQAAARMPCVVQSWRRYEWGERDLTLDKLDAVAAAIGATREALLAEQGRILAEARP